MELKDLAAEFVAIKAEYEKKENELKEINARWEKIEQEIMEQMALDGIAGIDLEGVGYLGIKNQNYLSVTGDHKQAFFEYLRESGNESLLRLDVPTNTLKAFLSEHVETLTNRNLENGMDKMEAKSEALEFLKSKGAGYFTKRSLSFKKEK